MEEIICNCESLPKTHRPCAHCQAGLKKVPDHIRKHFDNWAREAAIRDCAAYVLDRADQYADGSGCWVALADASHNMMLGEVDAAKKNGDLGDDLMKRVDGFRQRGSRKPKPVDPMLGVDDDMDEEDD